MPEAWRLLKQKHAPHAFDGVAARRFGGRWNSPGRPVVYTAAHLSLAALEVLVHLEDARVLDHYVAFKAVFDDALVTALPTRKLPADWRLDPVPTSTQALGDDWVDRAESAVLRVPSVVVPTEWNYVLSPRHPDFDGIAIEGPLAFDFDPRLAAHSA